MTTSANTFGGVQNYDDDPVLQPGVSATYRGLTAMIWGSLETTNINGNSGDFSEVDYSLYYPTMGKFERSYAGYRQLL